MKTRRPRRRWYGFTLVELTAVAALVAAIPTARYARAKAQAQAVQEINKMRQIGQLLQMHQLESGSWPKASFYPEDPENGADSIRSILGGDPRLWVSSAMPAPLQAKGLTYVYNDRLAGRRSVSGDEWVLIDMTCVAPQVPAPYPRGWNILYADGRVDTTTNLPEDIQKARRAQRRR